MRFRQSVHAAIFCAGICLSCATSLAAPPQTADPTSAGVDVAFRQALDEIGSLPDGAEQDALLAAWIDYFEGISPADDAVASHIADLLSELRALRQPTEYVRICDAFGPGYFYVPGTDTCLPGLGGRDFGSGPAGANRGLGFYARGGFGFTQPLDDLALKEFNQAADLGSNLGGTVELGADWPTNFDLRFKTGFRAVRLENDVESLLNLLLGNGTPASGNADLWAALAVISAEFPLAGLWAGEASVGIGRGWLDFNLNSAGGTASASGGGLTTQFGVGVERFLNKCLALGMTAYFTHMASISGATGTGTPFHTNPLTTLSVMAIVSYRFGGLSNVPNLIGCS